MGDSTLPDDRRLFLQYGRKGLFNNDAFTEYAGNLGTLPLYPSEKADRVIVDGLEGRSVMYGVFFVPLDYRPPDFRRFDVWEIVPRDDYKIMRLGWANLREITAAEARKALWKRLGFKKDEGTIYRGIVTKFVPDIEEPHSILVGSAGTREFLEDQVHRLDRNMVVSYCRERFYSDTGEFRSLGFSDLS
ncbi:hypothetical protein ACFL0V_04040 [Nanoarchaeota archaeon]